MLGRGHGVGRQSRRRRIVARRGALLALGCRQMRGGVTQGEQKTDYDPAGSGRWRSSVLTKVNATCPRATNRWPRDILGFLLQGSLMIPGQPQVPRRHATPGTPGGSTPQSGLIPAGPLTGLRHVGALKPDASHLWLPRHMELPHGYIARTSWGVTGLSRHDRERHVYIVGKSGSGKSTTLFNLAMHDIVAGEGVAVIDPHGDLVEAVADCIPPDRTHAVCYLDAGDAERPVGFNPLAQVAPERHALAASGMVSAFKHLWRDSWGPRLEHFLFHGIMALLAAPRATLIDLPLLYTDDQFRARTVARVRDPITARFWMGEYPQYDDRYRAEAAGPILNKVGQLAASPALRAILGQHTPKFDLAYAMDNRGIFLANLAKGRVGEQAANLLGSLLISHLQLAAMERSAQAPEYRVPFFAHIDEFQSFGTDAFASLLSEARKFAAHFCLANQYIDQLDPSVRAAVLGNAGALIVFRVSGYDAMLLASEFDPLPPSELVDQAPYTAWLRRGVGHEHVDLLPRLYEPLGRLELVRRQSRRNFGRPRDLIEQTFRNTN